MISYHMRGSPICTRSVLVSNYLIVFVLAYLIGNLVISAVFAQDGSGSGNADTTEEVATPEGDEAMAEEEAAPELSNLDTVWMLVAGFLVFFMQAGFALVEAGFRPRPQCCQHLHEEFLRSVYRRESVLGHWLWLDVRREQRVLWQRYVLPERPARDISRPDSTRLCVLSSSSLPLRPPQPPLLPVRWPDVPNSKAISSTVWSLL